MIYDGKEYVEIAKDDANAGDLVHITEVFGDSCDEYEFIDEIDVDDGDFIFDALLPDNSRYVGEFDEFKTYRYVKDVEENSSFSVGDTVLIVGKSVTGRDEFIEETSVITFIDEIGDIQIVEGDGFNGWYRPSSLELIEKQTQPIAEELSEKVESNAITLAEAADNLVTSKAWTQPSEVKGKSPGTLAGKAMQSFSEAIVRAWAKPSEANVKEGDYMVITDNNNEHEFEIGAVVKVIKPYSRDDEFIAETAGRRGGVYFGEGVWYVEYADARFATADEIAEATTADATENAKGVECGSVTNPLKTQIDDFYGGMSALLVAKNENYGDSFSKQYDKYGMQGVEMRLNDKFMRLEQLIAGQPDKVGESVEDTLKDIIGYSTLALLKINENRTELSA